MLKKSRINPNSLYIKSDREAHISDIYEFTPKNYNQASHNKVSYRKLKLSNHAVSRAQERLSLYSKDELKKLATSAKYKGINLNGVTMDNYEALGIPYEALVAIRRTTKSPQYNNNKNYLYKSIIFTFNPSGNVLVTLLPLTNSTVEKYNKNLNSESFKV